MQEAEASGLEAALQAARWGWQSAESKLKAAYSQIDARGSTRPGALKAAPKAAPPTASLHRRGGEGGEDSAGGAAGTGGAGGAGAGGAGAGGAGAGGAGAGGAPKLSEAAVRRDMVEKHKEEQRVLREEARVYRNSRSP